jgi:hypothetical protein
MSEETKKIKKINPKMTGSDTSSPSGHSSTLFFMSHILAMANVTCNPFVYFWLNKVSIHHKILAEKKKPRGVQLLVFFCIIVL